MYSLPEGTYVIGDPSRLLLPVDYRKLTKSMIFAKDNCKNVVGGICPSDDKEHKFAYYFTSKGILLDQFGYKYICDSGIIACIPIEMLTHLDSAFLEPFKFFDEFRTSYNHGLVYFNHVQIRPYGDS